MELVHLFLGDPKFPYNTVQERCKEASLPQTSWIRLAISMQYPLLLQTTQTAKVFVYLFICLFVVVCCLLFMLLLPCSWWNIYNKLSPRGGGETICSRRWQFDSRRIYVRPRTGPQSAHLWWSSQLQTASVPIARLPGSCATQPACYSLGWDRQADVQTDRRTDRGIA